MSISTADERSTAELLALLLLPDGSDTDMAEVWLSQTGGLRGLLGSDVDDLKRLPNIGPVRARRVRCIAELAARYQTARLPDRHAIRSPGDTYRFLRAKLRDLEHEVFCCLYLDNRHRVLDFQILFRGTIDGTSVYPREVVKEALRRNAAALIVAHNHPSGVAEPSQADADITRRLNKALALVDIRLLDHVVVGDSDTVSLAARGQL
ncbi:MAG: DNA repair protein RadC [Pseudomonadota bacterium]